MKKLISPWLVFGVFVGFVAILVSLFVGKYNQYVNIEEGIVAADKSRQTVLNNLSQKVKEVIGIRQLSVDDIKNTVTQQIKSRSGEGGYRAYVLMLQEHNVAPDPTIYQKIINIIDVGRSGFENSEKLLIDRKQIACAQARQVPNKWILSIMGLPSLRIGCGGIADDYAPILSTTVKDTFDTGVDQGLY